MLDAGPNARLPAIGRAPLERRGRTMGEVASVGRTHAEDGGLAGVRRVAPVPPFVAVQQPGPDVAVVDVGRRHLDGVNAFCVPPQDTRSVGSGLAPRSLR